MGAEFVHGLFGSCPWRQSITAVIPTDRIWRVKTRMFASSIIAITYTPPATRHHPFHTLNKMAAVHRTKCDVHFAFSRLPPHPFGFLPPAGRNIRFYIRFIPSYETSDTAQSQTRPLWKGSLSVVGLCSVCGRRPPIGRTLGLVLSLKPRYRHTKGQQSVVALGGTVVD